MTGKVAMNLAMVALFCIAAVMLVPAALGFHRYVILTGSMTGTYDAGSIVFDRPVSTDSLRVGDVITYAPPPGASPSHDLVTHRIHRIATAADGRRVYQTKGDFNPVPDVWRFVLPQATQDKVVFSLPYVGFVFEFLSVPKYRKIVIGLPAVLVAMWVLAGLWKEGGEAQRRRERGIAPWSDDVGRSLPQLDPAAGGEVAVVLAAVHVEITWPQPARGRRRGELPSAPRWVVGPAAALAEARRARGPRMGAGRVALPAACVARARGRRAGAARALPTDWRLVVRRPQHLLPPDAPA
jgi:signal peptidase